MPMESGYQRLLRNPLWQKRRLDVLNAANWRCQDAGCSNSEVPLEIHHCYYLYGKKPWDYPSDAFLALCEQCHEKRQQLERDIKLQLLKCLRDVPIRRLETVAWKLVVEALATEEVCR